MRHVTKQSEAHIVIGSPALLFASTLGYACAHPCTPDQPPLLSQRKYLESAAAVTREGSQGRSLFLRRPLGPGDMLGVTQRSEHHVVNGSPAAHVYPLHIYRKYHADTWWVRWWRHIKKLAAFLYSK